MLWLVATSHLLNSAAEVAASAVDWLQLPPGVTRVECDRAQRKLKQLLQESRPAQQAVQQPASDAAEAAASSADRADSGRADSGRGSEGSKRGKGKTLEQWGSHRIFLSLTDMSDEILHYTSSSVSSSPKVSPQ
jgi:hypothetical protein